jgi:signal peptidase I
MNSINCLVEMPSATPGNLRDWERKSPATEFDRAVSSVPPGAEATSDRRPAKMAGKSAWRKLSTMVIILLLSLVAYFFFSRFVVMTVVVQGRSMAPTLRDGEHLMLNRMAYLLGTPARGDLVVLKDPGHSDYAVKRVVGLPGDALYFDKGEVYLNGRKLRERYLGNGLPTFTPDFKKKCVALTAGEYFVLGDNRGNSEDSRFYGAIRQSAILGLIWR